MVKDYDSEDGRIERIANFTAALKKYVPALTIPVQRILLVGCGQADEVPALKEFFGKPIEIVGIDIDKERVQKANKFYGGQGIFITGDATNLRSALGKLVNKFKTGMSLLQKRNKPKFCHLLF